MSHRFETPDAVPAPAKPTPLRAGAPSQTIWLSEPIDLKTAVERLHGRLSPAPRRDDRLESTLEASRRFRTATSGPNRASA